MEQKQEIVAENLRSDTMPTKVVPAVVYYIYAWRQKLLHAPVEQLMQSQIDEPLFFETCGMPTAVETKSVIRRRRPCGPLLRRRNTRQSSVAALGDAATATAIWQVTFSVVRSDRRQSRTRKSH
jgi:hypothetical protein